MNEEAVREFGISEKTVRDLNKISLIAICFIEFFIFLISLYLTLFIFHTSIIQFLTITGIIMFFYGIAFSITFFVQNRSFSKLKILIYEDRLERRRGRKQQVFFGDNINKVKITRKHNGDLLNIILSFDNPKRNIILARFDNMEDLLNLIKEMVSYKVIFQEKYLKKFQTGKLSVIIFALVLLMFCFIMAVFISFGGKAFSIFMGIFFILGGLITSIFKPCAKVETANKWIDILLGLGLLLMGFFILFNHLPGI